MGAPHDRAIAEVRELHVFLEEWMTGRLPATDAAYARFADVLDDGFMIVSPAGTITPREALVAGLKEAHGGRAQATPPFAIRIENPRVVRDFGDRLLVLYEEWQDTTEGTTARLSTVLFERRDGLPNGLAWLHLHETWMDGSAPAA